MYSSAYYGTDLLSFGTLELDFVSSVGLQGYLQQQSKSQCSLFVFHFQAAGSVFLLGTRSMIIETFTLCCKRAYSNALEGVVLKGVW